MPLVATFDPSGASRQLPFRRGAMRVAAYRTFSQTATQGRAGTPAPTTRLGRVRNLPPSVYVSSHTICWRGRVSLYLRYPPSHGRGVGDAAPYGWVRVRRVSNQTAPSQAAARGASGTPPLTGWFLTFPDCIHPPGSIRPRGVKRVKSLKGLTPQPPSAAAPIAGEPPGLRVSGLYVHNARKKTLDKIILLCYIGLAVS